MKKIKMILTAVTIFAVVGGALAFKTKTYSVEFCASTTANTNCAVISDKTETSSSSDPTYFKDANYVPGVSICSANICPTETHLIDEGFAE